jgi:hypothetical protein
MRRADWLQAKDHEIYDAAPFYRSKLFSTNGCKLLPGGEVEKMFRNEEKFLRAFPSVLRIYKLHLTSRHEQLNQIMHFPLHNIQSVFMGRWLGGSLSAGAELHTSNSDVSEWSMRGWQSQPGHL